MTMTEEDAKTLEPEPLEIPAQSPLIDRDIVDLVTRFKVIDPFNPDKLSGCSYDLRVGKEARSRNRVMKFKLDAGNDFYIEAGECVTVETLEVVNFREPKLFGYVVNKHSVLARGLVHPITKIDPGFKGHLAVTMFNHGNVAEKIQFEQEFVSLIIYPLHAVPDRIYGETQTPSSGPEGNLNIAGVMDQSPDPADDARLAKMYGPAVGRLYERVAQLEMALGMKDKTRG